MKKTTAPGRRPNERAGKLRVAQTENRWDPVVEVTQTPERLLVSADLPGLTREKIIVSVAGDFLTIAGERKPTNRDNPDNHYPAPQRYGKFFRQIPLPRGAEPARAYAEYTNGVLELSIPIS